MAENDQNLWGRERLLLAIAIFAYVITLNGLSTIFVNTNIDERIYDAPQDKRTFVQTFGVTYLSYTRFCL